MRARAHTHARTHAHTHTQTHTQTHTRARARERTRVRIIDLHASTLSKTHTPCTCVHVSLISFKHTHRYTHRHARARACTHARTHAHTHTKYTHKHVHAHARASMRAYTERSTNIHETKRMEMVVLLKPVTFKHIFCSVTAGATTISRPANTLEENYQLSHSSTLMLSYKDFPPLVL